MKSSELVGKKVAIGQITFTSIRTYHMLKRDGIDVKMFFDKDYRLQHKKYMGVPIFPWANFNDSYVILTIPSRYVELKTLLMEECGYPEEQIIFLDDIEFDCMEFDVSKEYDWSWIAENTNDASGAFIYQKSTLLQHTQKNIENPVSMLFCVEVNNKCTLNCKYCYAQMPYYQPEERQNFNMNRILRDLDQLLNYIDSIPYLWIIGGEPLLHPELYKLIEYLNGSKAQQKIGYADILTNGTLLLSDKVISAIKENPLFWRISASPYGVYSRKQYELMCQLNENGIPYYSRYMVYWQKFGLLREPSSTSEESIKDKCDDCICRNVHMVHGKLYRCPVVAHFEILDRIPYDVRNSLDLSKSYTKDDLRQFLSHYSPGMAYCNASHQTYIKDEDMTEFSGDKVPVAEQTFDILPRR